MNMVYDNRLNYGYETGSQGRVQEERLNEEKMDNIKTKTTLPSHLLRFYPNGY
jgi:hypothetical protein